MGDFTWRVSDCEELVGVTHRRTYEGYSLYVTPLRLFDVPEVLLSQEVPSDEVRMFPLYPTVTNLLFPYVTPIRCSDVPEVPEVHDVPLSEVSIFPEFPTVTKVLVP